MLVQHWHIGRFFINASSSSSYFLLHVLIRWSDQSPLSLGWSQRVISAGLDRLLLPPLTALAMSSGLGDRLLQSSIVRWREESCHLLLLIARRWITDICARSFFFFLTLNQLDSLSNEMRRKWRWVKKNKKVNRILGRRKLAGRSGRSLSLYISISHR